MLIKHISIFQSCKDAVLVISILTKGRQRHKLAILNYYCRQLNTLKPYFMEDGLIWHFLYNVSFCVNTKLLLRILARWKYLPTPGFEHGIDANALFSMAIPAMRDRHNRHNFSIYVENKHTIVCLTWLALVTLRMGKNSLLILINHIQ